MKGLSMNDRMLILQNIGAVKEAQIYLNGICVIAGENDTGKSTIAKVLMAMIKTHNIVFWKRKKRKNADSRKEFNILANQLFDSEISQSGFAKICEEEKTFYQTTIKNNLCVDFKSNEEDLYRDVTYIQGSFIWDFFDFFRNVRLINDNAQIYGSRSKLVYPYLFWDLYQKIEEDIKENFHIKGNLQNIKQKITEIIDGNFLKINKKTYKFYRNNQEISLKNVATGIKQLGILQTLLNNNRITPQGFLIFDEPENHLHPKWQLVFAEILVQLSALKIPIIINSHSPNFIEAIYKYGIKHQIPTHFHLADDGVIKKYDESNERTLELIFEKLNAVFETFEKLDSESYEKSK